MARWIVLGLAVIILWKMVGNEMRKRSAGREKESAREEARKKAAGQMVKDPVCGKYVEVDGGISVRDGDKVHRFCSYDCRDTFLKQLQDGGREIPAKTKDDAE
ncbi:transcriptional regulator [Desulfovibrio sp. OttesenSCG-928-I05]|nr:transcriptional regulator [Desulfovibrio sp. OttesenSCG-928-I05]